ncbi:hypothetical protein AVEN_205915-1 [Araneus ventricosus]|uniref:Transposase Tc1-like domain-containing protein n=1 Tax=Araneus ventricosus TaxID=182803 RepID=A0A4Y2NL22_ARAVE|nr:hypothetical protein AVEN_205915-1 [Araneus ventricosus]
MVLSLAVTSDGFEDCFQAEISVLLLDTTSGVPRGVYARRYPSRRPPDVNVIRRLDDRLLNTGSVLPTANLHDTGRPRSGLTVAQADAILQRVEETTEVSTRALAREMTSSKSTVHRLLWSERLHPFRYTTVQGLKQDDFQKRVAFCEWLLQQQSTENGFIAHILWTDESCFPRDGVFNHHNSHMWSQVNPHAIRPQKHQERWFLNVWAGILGDRLLGPYLLPERLSRQSYLVFLNEVLTEFLDDISLAAIQGLWFQHDGLRRIFVLLYVVGWIWNTPAAGSDVGVRFYGRHVHQILHRWIFSYGAISRNWCIET